ncbi:MAG: phosphonate ABC transporter, permease protein PhnE [Gammaproteobacteria bacterium]|nr:phosphonate ABC transporter, permease protein PhnE [Gammaproteobacteria bacterium]
MKTPNIEMQDNNNNRQWSRFKYPQSVIRYGILLGILIFLSYSVHYLNIPLERFLGMFGRLGDVLANRYYPPDMDYLNNKDFAGAIIETIQMAYLGALFGLVLAIFLGWFAAYNVSPSRKYVYPLARLFAMGCRSVHEMIWAILFVTILGFGLLPGVLALTMFSIGFAGKLFAEEVESIDMGEVEAIRAMGGTHLQVFVFGVFPQVRVAFTGIAIYTWDVAFRAATVVGFVGAGGMGWYLKRNIMQIETERTAAILLSIVFLVVISEFVSAWARRRVSKAK